MMRTLLLVLLGTILLRDFQHNNNRNKSTINLLEKYASQVSAHIIRVRSSRRNSRRLRRALS